MPELPEVEIVRVGLNNLTTGKMIQGGEVLLKSTVAHPSSLAQFWLGIQGTTISNWERRGKYLLANLQNSSQKQAGWLGVHLRMTGQLLWLSQGSTLQKHTRLRWFLGNDQELRFVDIRTFGKVWWVPSQVEPEKIITGLKELGPEPLTQHFHRDYLVERLRHSQRRIKTVLLDQRIIAGIGNIYADEALFKSGIKPEAIANQLSLEEVKKLHIAIIEVLEQGIAAGGTTFSNFINVVGINGNYGNLSWVYRRMGQPCKVCGTTIERIKLGGRSAHFCPKCQR
ncbi:DNA-formamidopyrimidine glycosylase [Gloeocapsa sp. PCC 73106]|uniref:DNA-formamidopyrimidine glycosylase n=1 Tax=Gloeocapsa sp. PCC 73106 TaxID=102232 RepID=UPI0002ACDA7C|nr:DNA-formamidopyrimidine glycosylase [Gloeocapsa sp. PCC 73106]ELR98352.1 formamidopyrimidine-DNA glycosylase Fpg [Gloeocapsa sp. PCC 73106]